MRQYEHRRMFTEGQRVVFGESKIEARFVRLEDEADPEPKAIVCFDDGTIDVVDCDDIEGL